MPSLLKLVESLETGLTDTKAQSQRQSLKALLDGIRLLDINEIQTTEVDYLVEFLSSRLTIADPETVCLLLDGFLWLAETRRTNGALLLTPDQAARVCLQGVFAHLVVTDLPKSSRSRVFRLLHMLLTGPHITGLLEAQDEFVMPYVQSVDGEKDPENLTLIFEMNVIVIERFNLDRVKDDFFEIMSVYFPISYSPSSDNELPGINRQTLAAGLHRCLFAARLFAGHELLPLLCEKADGDWSDGCLNALALLADSLHGALLSMSDGRALPENGRSIPLNHVSSYLVLIVPLLEKIAKQKSSPKVESLALSCVSGLVYCYSSQTTDVHRLKDFVVTFCKGLGVPVDGAPSGGCPEPPPDRIKAYLVEAIKYGGRNSFIRPVLLHYLISFYCAPMFDNLFHTWSGADISQPDEALESLIPWTSSITFANHLLDACAQADENVGRSKSEWHSDKMQLILARLSRTSAITHRLLVEMHSLSKLRSTPLSDRQIQLLVLCSSLGGLHVRLWRFRWLHDASADWTNSPGDLEVVMENLSNMVGFFDNSQIFSDSNPLLQSNRNDLICTVSNLYTLPVGSAIDKLSNLLFNQIKGPQNGVDVCSLVLEVLQHAACFDPRIFERLISFFISSCSADLSDLKPTSCKLNHLSYVLQFVAKSLLESNQNDRKLITCLMKNLYEQRRFFCSLTFAHSVSFLESLERIGFAFRIATCLSDLQQQKELFLAYKETLSENSSTSPSAIILLCFIATGICGETVLLENIADLLSEFMKYATAVLCSDSEDPDCSVDALLSTFIAQGYASVLNKCPEPLPQDVVLTFSEHMEQSQRSKELTLPIGFTQIWSTWCLRSLISHPGQSRFPLVGRILDVLFSTFQSQGTRQTKISEPQQLSMAFLEKQFKNFCSPAPQVGDITSDLCHWQSTSLFEQKCCVLILDPLAARLRRFHDSSEANSVTKDAFLLAYLNLSSQLPADLLTNQLNEVIQNCLDAITQSSSPSVQSAGLQLFYLLFNRMRSEKNGLFSQISPAYADDLFDALPHLARASLPSLLPEADGDVGRREDNRSKTVSLETVQAAAQVRLCIARCLGCLINLPADIINRHRDTEVFPLLANLVDDPNRCVRLEAARAQNSWYLRG